MIRALSVIPYESQKLFLMMIKDIVPTTIVSKADFVVDTVNKAGGAVVTLALAGIQLTYEAIVNIRRWWEGEISGKRCCKNIIDSFAAVGGGIGGGFAGVAVGALGDSEVGKIFAQVSVTKSEAYLNLDEGDFYEKRLINKRKKWILEGLDPDEEEAKLLKKHKKKKKSKRTKEESDL